MIRVFICPECGNIIEYDDTGIAMPNLTCFCRWPDEVIVMEEMRTKGGWEE